MANYKILNITDQTGKRDRHHNLTLDVDFVVGMIGEKKKIRPGEFIIIKSQKLPLSVHKLRLEGLVSVTEISDKETNSIEKIVNPSKGSEKVMEKTTTTTIKPKSKGRGGRKKKPSSLTTTTKEEVNIEQENFEEISEPNE